MIIDLKYKNILSIVSLNPFYPSTPQILNFVSIYIKNDNFHFKLFHKILNIY